MTVTDVDDIPQAEELPPLDEADEVPPPPTRVAVTTRHRTPRPKKTRRRCLRCWRPAHPPWPRPDQGSAAAARSGWWPPPGWPRWPGWPTGCTAEPKNTPAGDRDRVGVGSSDPPGSRPVGPVGPVVWGHCLPARDGPVAEVPGPPAGPRAVTAPPGLVDALPGQEPGCWAGQVLPARDAPPPDQERPVGACWVGRLVPGPAP